MTSHRSRSPYGAAEKAGRIAWAAVQATLFAGSFHTWYRWRAFLLRRFGATIHPTARIRRTVRVECPWNLTVGEDTAVGDRVLLYCLGPVTLGARVSVSQGAHLCAGTHDYRSRSMTLLRPPITVGDDAWICADAFVGPGVTVGAGAILGARAVAMKSVEPWGIHAGNPAVMVKPRPPFRDGADGSLL
jgi:putative colanic acid biosynthesis acetyltransferase WcaF